MDINKKKVLLIKLISVIIMYLLISLIEFFANHE